MGRRPARGGIVGVAHGGGWNRPRVGSGAEDDDVRYLIGQSMDTS